MTAIVYSVDTSVSRVRTALREHVPEVLQRSQRYRVFRETETDPSSTQIRAQVSGCPVRCQTVGGDPWPGRWAGTENPHGVHVVRTRVRASKIGSVREHTHS